MRQFLAIATALIVAASGLLTAGSVARPVERHES